MQAMAKSNVWRQQQCQGIPSMSGPFSSDFGHLADTPSATAVLDGTCVPPPGTDPHLCKFLVCLQRLESSRRLGPIMTTVTPDQNCHAWRTQDERKATEPSGSVLPTAKLRQLARCSTESTLSSGIFPLTVASPLQHGKPLPMSKSSRKRTSDSWMRCTQFSSCVPNFKSATNTLAKLALPTLNAPRWCLPFNMAAANDTNQIKFS